MQRLKKLLSLTIITYYGLDGFPRSGAILVGDTDDIVNRPIYSLPIAWGDLNPDFTQDALYMAKIAGHENDLSFTIPLMYPG